MHFPPKTGTVAQPSQCSTAHREVDKREKRETGGGVGRRLCVCVCVGGQKGKKNNRGSCEVEEKMDGWMDGGGRGAEPEVRDELRRGSDVKLICWR